MSRRRVVAGAGGCASERWGGRRPEANGGGAPARRGACGHWQAQVHGRWVAPTRGDRGRRVACGHAQVASAINPRIGARLRRSAGLTLESSRASCANRVCGDEAAVLLAPIIGRVEGREAVVERRKIINLVKRETEYHSSSSVV